MPRLAGQQDLGRIASEDPRTPAGMDADAADWMRDHQDKVRQVNRNARINDLELQALGAVQDLETEVMNDPNTNPATLEATFQARAERLRDRIAEAIKDPEVEQPFRDYYGHLSGRSRAKVASLARERMVADGLASLDRTLDRYEAHYAGLTDADERRRVKDLVQRKIGDAIDTDLLTLDDGVRTFRTWEGDVDRAWLDRQVSDWAGRQSGALAAQRGFATGRFGDAQIEEAWNRRDPEERKALATGVLKQLDAQRTARREAAAAAVAARKNEADALVVELHRTDDPGRRRALLDRMEKAGVLTDAQLDRLREDLDAGEGTGAGDDPWVLAILQDGILRGDRGLADITGADGLSPQGRRQLIDLWQANRDPALAKGVEEIRIGLGVTRSAAQNDDATLEATAGAITELKEKAAREENPDVRAIGREVTAKAKETLSERQAEPLYGATRGLGPGDPQLAQVAPGAGIAAPYVEALAIAAIAALSGEEPSDTFAKMDPETAMKLYATNPAFIGKYLYDRFGAGNDKSAGQQPFDTIDRPLPDRTEFPAEGIAPPGRTEFPADPPRLPDRLENPIPESQSPDPETFPDQSGEFEGYNIQEARKTPIPEKPLVFFDEKRQAKEIEENAAWLNSEERRASLEKRRRGESIVPAEVPYWQKMKHETPRDGRPRRSNGLSGKKKRFFEWDFKHQGEIEVYDHTGKKHLGVIDPLTQKWIKGPKAGRKTRVQLEPDDQTRSA